jgi:hypothetical protein
MKMLARSAFGPVECRETQACEPARAAGLITDYPPMGYDLHITRKEDWSDEDGPTISEAEWRCVIEEDPELQLDTETSCTMSDGEYVYAAWNGEPGALGYYNGEITTKNPEQPLIRKMVSIARRLNATVQGDDGEIYREDGTSFQPESSIPSPAPAQPGLLARIASWFRHRRNVRELQEAAPAFRAGQRVKNPWGDLGTVLSVDHNANGGLGSVRVRLDDGREQNLACVASGLEIVGDEAGG